MRKLFAALLFVSLALSSCESYALPGGGYAFDVSIRIQPPAQGVTLTPSRTPSPTLTPTRAITLQPTITPEPSPTQEIFLPTSEPMLTGVVTVFKLNVRTSPGTEHPLSTARNSVTFGMEVEILAQVFVGNVEWYQIAIPPDANAIGWVSGTFIRLDHG